MTKSLVFAAKIDEGLISGEDDRNSVDERTDTDEDGETSNHSARKYRRIRL